ncbi:CBO0543 family protein [Bacillus sp. SG-1]|uniref:CBO0543 family protein n=1 Tax=Bacillus sp. SG-1 TaxID=161544 RepID=UPI0001545089|nr:CBO0543 family protein [Bacillus sp. SG-1]EDL63539.1 hypothetical protein BSG1_06854 [Bacillus sp. SG-1]
MDKKQMDLLHTIRTSTENLTNLQLDYWKIYSGFTSWKFWLEIAMLVIPLIILLLFIDRKRALLLGFFGLNYHVWFAYTNAAGIRLGLWEYPYQLLPFLPSFPLDASFVPIAFMLLYQWTLNREKNVYLYSIVLSAVFAFLLKPVMVYLDLFRMFDWVNYLYLFLFYIAFFVVSMWITNIFIRFEKKKPNN